MDRNTKEQIRVIFPSWRSIYQATKPRNPKEKRERYDNDWGRFCEGEVEGLIDLIADFPIMLDHSMVKDKILEMCICYRQPLKKRLKGFGFKRGRRKYKGQIPPRWIVEDVLKVRLIFRCSTERAFQILGNLIPLSGVAHLTVQQYDKVSDRTYDKIKKMYYDTVRGEPIFAELSRMINFALKKGPEKPKQLYNKIKEMESSLLDKYPGSYNGFFTEIENIALLKGSLKGRKLEKYINNCSKCIAQNWKIPLDDVKELFKSHFRRR